MGDEDAIGPVGDEALLFVAVDRLLLDSENLLLAALHDQAKVGIMLGRNIADRAEWQEPPDVAKKFDRRLYQPDVTLGGWKRNGFYSGR